MKIISYSDLHLEFGSDFKPPKDEVADLMILAGDIINLNNYAPLDEFLKNWKKSVLYVNGNHEYYTQRPMNIENENFKDWLKQNYPQVILLQDEFISIQGVHFFGGTMWTDFANANKTSIERIRMQMSDFRLIQTADLRSLEPMDTVLFHQRFVNKLMSWFEMPLHGPRVVITHHAPVIHPYTIYQNSPLTPAFVSLDMPAIIQKMQPQLWIYGHTHECNRQTIGVTQMISNPLGYPKPHGGYECKDFDPLGVPIDIRAC